MSYIKLTIGGKERGLKFNQLAIMEMKGKMTLNIEATVGYALIWGGLVACCYVKQEEIDFTFEEVCDWVDVMSEGEIEKALAVLNETEIYKKTLAFTESQKQAESNSKKKSPLKNTASNV